MKNIKEITKEELDNIKVVTFDIDGVIAPTGTKIREEDEGTKLYMESKPLSDQFIENLKKLEKYVRLNFSSGRNILYLKSLVNEIFDERTILQAENGNITWLDNKITHPVYKDEYFDQLRDLKEKIKEMKKNDSRIRGFEPKLLILTVHCEQMEEIPNLVKEISKDSMYCLWTNEGYDIGNKEMSKGVAINNLAKSLKIDVKQIMTTGNNYNDQEMLEIGKGVSVKPDRVKAEYSIEPKEGELGGELLVEFLLEYFENK
ncbi:MAG: HAD family phosphatase [Candidatus Portnoybacteria bacterium]|nr:HAD family phosphatase [Candidatus Portnoybacteria bacterium]